jgi:sulfide:quinone oxidoreductase
MLHDLLSSRGVREQLRDHSRAAAVQPGAAVAGDQPALVAAFAERGIRFMPNRRVSAVDAQRRVATLDDGSELAWDLFLGVPKHARRRWCRRPA